MPPRRTSSPTGRVKACNACRQLKLRCDARETEHGPCFRCRRMDRECVMTSSFKRQRRQTKAELQRELDSLRAQHKSSDPIHITTTASHQPAAASQSSTIGQQLAGSGAALPSPLDVREPGVDPSNALPASQVSPLQTANWSSAQLPREPGSGTPIVPYGAVPDSQSTPVWPGALDTVSQRVGQVELSAKKIDGCFSMFFAHYAPVVPGIFDHDSTPNGIYEYSHFLFWSIIYVGARKYPKDPTIVELLGRPLKELAQQTLFDPDHAIPTIQAAILLCLWPLPVTSTFTDPTHAISGAAMQLAMQKGLSHSSRKQDFARVALRPSQNDRLFRARLWAHCLTTFQSTSYFDGLNFAAIVDRFNMGEDHSFFDGLPSVALYQYHLHRLQTGAFTTIMRTVDLVSTIDGGLLESLIEHFDLQAQRISPLQICDLGRFAFLSTRLMIRAFHFFGSPTLGGTPGILQLYFIACELIKVTSQLDQSQEFVSHCTHLQARCVGLAAVSILRIQRSVLGSQVDTEVGEEMYFAAIHTCKKRSIQSNDLDARMAVILTQLWSSTRVFKFKNGSVDGLRLLLRGRMFMSPLFDCLWWWRTEFDGKANPYVEPDIDASTASLSNTVGPLTPAVAPQNPDSFSQHGSIDLSTFPDLLNDISELPDWNWEGLEGLDWDLA